MSTRARFIASARRLSHDFPIPTLWQGGFRALLWFLAVVSVGFVLQVVARPAGWPLAFLFAEDGQVFLTEALRDGPNSLLTTYAGYLHVAPRSIALACSSLVSPDAYVVCTGIAVAGVKALAVLVAWPVLSAYARSWGWGLAAASSFLFIPTGNLEVLGNITNLRWYLVAVSLFALIGVFQRAPLALIATAFAFLATTSDPLAFAWLPIAVWRALGQRGFARLPGLAALIGIALHLIHLQPGARGERGTAADLIANPLDTVAQLLIRGPVATQYGMNWTQEFLRFGVAPTLLTLVLTGAIVWAAWQHRGHFPEASRLALAVVIAGEALLLAVLSFPASYIAFTEIWSLSQPSRYSAFAALFLTPALVLAVSIVWRSNPVRWQRAVSALGVLVLIGAFISDGRGDPRHSSGPRWDETLVHVRGLCSDGRDFVEVANVPDYEGWRTTIQCDWLRQ